MKTLVVGDLHGQHEIAQAALDTGYPVVFVGDYLDSFSRGPVDQVRTLQLVLDAVHAGAAQAIRGNHETSYINDERCSGWNPVTAAHVMHLDTSALQDFIWCEDFLITHAGVSQKFLDMLDLTLEQFLDFPAQFETVGRRRGGIHPAGGPRWCHFPHEFEPVPGVSQVFGHSRQRFGIQNYHNNWCIDCLEDGFTDVLLIEGGRAQKVDLYSL